MRKYFSVKAIPQVFWSSPQALNLKPRALTVVLLSVGLLVFGLGEALLIAANAGVSPWTVLAQGIALKTGLGIGVATFLVSAVVLVLWIPMRQRPGVGTILNALLIAGAIELALPHLPAPAPYWVKILQALCGIFLVGFGSGVYLIANLGPGPRDGLMTGLQRLSGFPIAWVRMSIEILAVLLGWSLGGVVGLATLLFALGIGWAVSLGLYLVAAFSNAITDAEVVQIE